MPDPSTASLLTVGRRRGQNNRSRHRHEELDITYFGQYLVILERIGVNADICVGRRTNIDRTIKEGTILKVGSRLANSPLKFRRTHNLLVGVRRPRRLGDHVERWVLGDVGDLGSVGEEWSCCWPTAGVNEYFAVPAVLGVTPFALVGRHQPRGDLQSWVLGR